MPRAGPEPVDKDSRGILDPWLLRRHVTLTRYPPGDALAGLVDRLWAVQWDLPRGTTHRQELLTHPAANLSVESGEPGGRCSGVARRLTSRLLQGRGWAVAAMTTPGGLGAFITGPATAFTDRVAPLGAALNLDDAALCAQVGAQPDQPSRAAALARALEAVVAAADPERVRQARRVGEIARLAETDRSVQRLADLCAASGVGARTLQRMFAQHAGVSPTWVLRRYRLLDAAEAVRDGRRVSWAALAAELGYADQAHLTRDFTAATGRTPAAYARSQRDQPAATGSDGGGRPRQPPR